MKVIGISIDYSNICKDYNTVYLDRDNLDPQTTKCMKQVLTWSKGFLSSLLEHFELNLYNLSSSTPVKVEDVAAKRFLFYSLEKEITLQSFVIDNKYVQYDNVTTWESDNNNSVLIKNDEDGGCVSLYFNEGSKEHLWIMERLRNFSLDEVSLEKEA